MNNTDSQIIIVNKEGMIEENPQFTGCDDLVLKNGHPKALDNNATYNYQGHSDQKLLELAIKHTIKHQRPIEADNILVLGHAFYLSLNGESLNNAQQIEDTQKYLSNLVNFLNSATTDKTKLQIVGVETLQHYWSGSNILLEMNMVDKVVFTSYDCGTIYPYTDLRELEDKNVYYAGCSNGRCLSSLISSLNKRVVVNNKFAIKELCLNNPDIYSKSLEPLEIESDIEVPLISIKEFYNILQI